jgi:integrase
MDIPEKSKENILKFDSIGEHNKLSLSTRLYRLNNLRTFSKYVTKDFDKVTDTDIINFLDQWKTNKGNKPSESFIYAMKVTLKVFFTWLSTQIKLKMVEANGKKVPKCVSWMKIRRREVELKEEILTPNEIKQLINACDNERDRAIISFLYDSGVRIGELLNMKIKDVKPDEYGCLVTVSGKTGTRTVRVVDSVPYLLLWLRDHPFKEDKEHSFWISLKKTYGETLKHSSILVILHKLGKRSGLKKKLFPHLFRHSSATRNAQFLYEHEMNTYYGWSNQSKMGFHYCHIKSENVNDKIATIHGKKPIEQTPNHEIEPIQCPRCQIMNPADAKFCYSCSCGFDKKETMEMDDVNSFMNWFVKDKDFRELVEVKKKVYEKEKDMKPSNKPDSIEIKEVDKKD